MQIYLYLHMNNIDHTHTERNTQPKKERNEFELVINKIKVRRINSFQLFMIFKEHFRKMKLS